MIKRQLPGLFKHQGCCTGKAAAHEIVDIYIERGLFAKRSTFESITVKIGRDSKVPSGS